MKIIISPAKKMITNTDVFPVEKLPAFLEDTRQLMREIRKLSYQKAKELWKCNEKLAVLNYDRFAQMDLERALTPAILAYEGLQYQYIAPEVFTEGALSYIRDHLRILSGFYGILSPFDGVTAYRLEMQAKLAVNGHPDLYGFWGNRLYEELTKEDHVILNLASKEYSKCIEKYVTDKDTFITVGFGEWIDGKVKQKGTFAKMARGEMVRFLAENQIQDVELLKEFQALGVSYKEELSNDTTYIFIKEK